MNTKNNTPADISFFSYAVLAPVRKPKVNHYKDASSALIAGLIEETLNPSKRIKTSSILTLTSI